MKLEETLNDIVNRIYAESPATIEEMVRWGFIENIAYSLVWLGMIACVLLAARYAWCKCATDEELRVPVVIISGFILIFLVPCFTIDFMKIIQTQVAPRLYVLEQFIK